MKFTVMPRYQMRKHVLEKFFVEDQEGFKERGGGIRGRFLKLDMGQEKYLICTGNWGFG